MIEAVVLGDLDAVAVAPDAGKALEVRGAVLARRRDRSRSRPASTGTATCRRARPARRRRQRLPSSSNTSTSMPEAAALDLAAPDRQRRIAEHEARHDVGAARDRRQADVVLDALVDVVEAFRRERAAGRKHRRARLPGRSPCAAPARSSSARRCTSPTCRSASSARRPRSPTARGRGRRTASRRRAAASRRAASPDTSQFHIIQPQVVK